MKGADGPILPAAAPLGIDGWERADRPDHGACRQDHSTAERGGPALSALAGGRKAG